MIFGKKKNTEKHILRLGITVNLSALPGWIKSGEVNVPVVPYAEWSNQDKFDYEIFVLPIDNDIDWYFHKNAGDFSHSINAIIELEKHFNSNVNIQGLCDGLPDLEIELWNGQMAITFCQRLIMMAPLSEAAHIMNTGNTSNENLMNPRKQEIEVPVAFDDSKVPTEFVTVYESTGSEGAGYSNQLVHFWMDSPKRLVVT